MSRSLVVYRGPSAYAPRTIIRAALVPAADSANRKTGAMAQLHILHDTIPPQVAQRTGADAAVCGTCPLRPALSGGCYVVTCQGPLSVFKATVARPVAGAARIAALLQGSTLRLGAYGDPAALPPHTVQHLAALVHGRATGYTHGWRMRPDLAPYCMASTETPADAAAAHAAGWRTFRARAPGAPVLPSEIDCPSPRVTCAACRLCSGNTLRARSISIEVHGFRMSRALAVVGG
jgi:hypothetical protein